MVLKLAWRNIWRNTRRTIISILALALGVMAIISIQSLQEVSYEAMIRGVTDGLIGHAQVHGRGYQDSPDMTNVVRDAVGVEARIKRAVPGVQMERRVLGAGLAGSEDVSTAVMVMGIEPANPSVNAVLTVEQGHGLGAAPAHEVVIGDALARELDVKPGGEMVLVGQAADGSLANDRFTIVGTADAGSSEANASAVFLHLADAQSFFALGEGVHQVIVRLPTRAEDLSLPVSQVRAAVGEQDLEVLSWSDMLPELKGVIDAKRRNTRVIYGIVFLIVALGILNTMTMATFERTREFGVMASLGTRRRRVLAMVLLEALLQGVIGFLIGLALAWALLHGIGTADLSSLGTADYLGAHMPGVLRLAIHPSSVPVAAVATIATMLAGGFLPALRASRFKPVEATRYV
jgi:ABC-type lipoprotein release transport system permease subunit